MKGMRGKALVVRGWQSYGSQPIESADWYAARFDWAMIVVRDVNAREVGRDVRLADFCRRLRARGVPVWLEWLLPKPEGWQREAEALFAFGAEVGAFGVSVNAEVEWKDQNEAARAFAADLVTLKRASGLKVALNSYPIPELHRTFPWVELAHAADVGVPEVYLRTGGESAQADAIYMQRSIKGYRDLGLRSVIPMGSLVRRTIIENAPDAYREKTPEELRAYLAQLPPTPGIAFWNTGRPSPEILEAVDNWSMTSTTPPLARMLLGATIADLVFGG